jgi:hypothetical protein
MNEDQLRALVRAAIARQAVSPASRPAYPVPSVRTHASHGMFTILPVGTDTDGPCLIEPAVMCNHCAYCTSYGH